MKTHSLACVLLLAALATPACARQPSICAPQVREGWVRLTPNDMPMHAGFGRIDNRCTRPATIVSASSPSYGEVELHETRMVDGVSRMRGLRELRIAPDKAAVLQPGGLHLMLIRPRSKLKAGGKVAIAFKLADGRTIHGEFAVRGFDD